MQLHQMTFSLSSPIAQLPVISLPQIRFSLYESSGVAPALVAKATVSVFPHIPPLKESQSMYLPPVPLPFRLQRHPDFLSLLHTLDSWILSVEQPTSELQKQLLLQARYPLLISHSFPHVHPDRLLDIGKMVYWVLRADDRLDDINDLGQDGSSAKELVQQHHCLLDGNEDVHHAVKAEHQQEKCVLSLKAPWDSMKLTYMQRHRIRTGIDFFLEGGQRQALLRQHKAILSVDEYTQLRRLTSAGIIMCTLIEYGLGIEIDEETWNTAEVQWLHEVFTDYICFSNDIYSCRKEIINGDLYNLPSIISVERECDLQKALLEACQIVESKIKEYQKAADKILKSPSFARKPGIVEYVDGCGYFCSGSTYWNWVSGRYHGLDWEPRNLPPHGMLQLDSERTILTPVTSS